MGIYALLIFFPWVNGKVPVTFTFMLVLRAINFIHRLPMYGGRTPRAYKAPLQSEDQVAQQGANNNLPSSVSQTVPVAVSCHEEESWMQQISI